MLKIFEKFTKLFNLIIGKVYHTRVRFFDLKIVSKISEIVALKGFGKTVLVFVFLNFGLSLYLFVDYQNYKSHKNLIVENSTQNLNVSFLDIGQGDSIFIEAPNGNSMLIDSGPAGGKVLGQISKIKNFFDRKIGVLIITHTDADHIGSMSDIIRKYDAQIFMESGVTSGTKIYDSLVDLIHNKNISQLRLTRGMKIVLDDSKSEVKQNSNARPKIYFEILFPTFLYQIDNYEKCMSDQMNLQKRIKKFRTCKKFLKLETNENSIVGRLVYGSITFMLTGDAPISVEKYLIERGGSSLKSDVLKLGHHGSRTSTSDTFLEHIQPSYAVISSGAKNRYGHPHEEVLKRLNNYFSKTFKISTDTSATDQASESNTLRTDTRGSITFESNASILRVKTER